MRGKKLKMKIFNIKQIMDNYKHFVLTITRLIICIV